LKKLLLIFLSAVSLFAGKVEIESLTFETYDERGISIFKGNVFIKKELDKMRADKVVVFVDDDKQIKKFEATGNTSFEIHLEDNNSFVGNADEFIYTPEKGELILIGNAHIKDVNNSREIKGETVVFYEKEKIAKVVGQEKKPVRLIFEINDGEKKSE